MAIRPQPPPGLRHRAAILWLGGLAALLLPCRGQTIYQFGNPTGEEQYYVELINRARANPPAEGVRLATTTDPDLLIAYNQFGVDLAMMQGEFNLIAAQPPLAPNASLTTSARSHSAWMLATATQTHDETNPANTAFTRMSDAGYVISTAGENIYYATKNVWFGHVGFQVDWGYGSGGMQDPRGHRANIHSANLREIGVGVVNGTNGLAGPQLVTQDFATSPSNPSFGTGVAYYDLNANHFYDIGEGIAGLTVEVSGATTYRCATASGGGWTIPVPATAATRTVTFSGLNLNQAVSLVVPAAKNAKADLCLSYAPPAITSSCSAAANTLHTLTFTPVGGASSHRWDRWTTAAAAAENCESLSNITTATTGSYAVLSTSVRAQGAASFHLENSTGASQSLQLGALYYGQTAAALSFQSSIRYATTSEVFKVQVKEEGSLVWQDVFSQAGTNNAGESGFTQRSAALAAMTGKAFRVRFLLNYGGGGYYNTSGNIVGWFIDAITFSGVATLGNNACQTLAGASGSFTPAVGSYLMAVTPVISERDFPASYQTLTVTAAASTPPAITSQPVSVTLNSGTTATFSVTASGTAPTFQWYAGTSGDTAAPVAGATNAAWTTPVLTDSACYWVRASNAAGAADSNTASATVTFNTPPVITSQPVSIAIKKNTNTTITLTVVASGSNPLSYQWYSGNSPSTTNKITGATSASYTTTLKLTFGTSNYWVRVTNPFGTANSNTAAVTIAVAPAITSQPVSVTLNSGTSATFSVASSGSAPSFQWYAGASGVTTAPVTGATGATFTTPALTLTTSYWVRVTNAAGSADSNSAAAVVICPPAIITQPVSTVIPSGGSATLSIAATGTTPSVQWYRGSSGVTSNPVAGATAPTFVTPPLTATTSYWALASNAAGTASSESATVTVNIPFSAWAATLEQFYKLDAGTIGNHPEADYDHDGRSNLIEYAFGASPVLGSDPAPRLPAPRTSDTHFILRYLCDTALTDITFTAQASTTPGQWKVPGEAGAPAGFDDVEIFSDGMLQTRETSVPRSAGACFMRVRITRQ